MFNYGELMMYETKMDNCFTERRTIIAMLLAMAIGTRIGVLYILNVGVILNPAINPTVGTYLMMYVLICVGFSGVCFIPYLVVEGVRKIYYTHKYKACLRR